MPSSGSSSIGQRCGIDSSNFEAWSFSGDEPSRSSSHLTRPRVCAAPSSFYIDCSRHPLNWRAPLNVLKCQKAKYFFYEEKNLLGKVVNAVSGPLKFLTARKGNKPAQLMDVLPREDNCYWTVYVLERMKRQWYKCCQKYPDLLMLMVPGMKYKCEKVQADEWYPQFTGGGNATMPFETEEAVECFSSKPDDFWNCKLPGYNGCTHRKSQCVKVGNRSEPPHWAADESGDSVSMYIFQSPSPTLFVLSQALRVPDPLARRQEEGGSTSSFRTCCTSGHCSGGAGGRWLSAAEFL